jgi:hypothetical protein
MSFRDTTAWLAKEEREKAERARKEAEERRRAEAKDKVDRPQVVDVNPYAGPPETWPKRAPDWYMAKYSFQKRR